MRKGPLTREEKEQAEVFLDRLRVKPPSAGQVIFHVDSQGKVSSVELSKVVWR